MLWMIATFIFNIIEQLLITGVIRDMNPVVYVALFYLFSTAFLFLYNLISHRHARFMNWQKVWTHQKLVIGFVGGAFVGNTLWFTSVFLIGIGMTSFLLIFIRVIVAVYAYIHMDDRFPLDKAVAFATGIMMLLVFSFSGGSANILGILAAVVSCFGFAVENITRKKLAEYNIKPENILFLRNIGLLALSWLGLGIGFMMNYVIIDDISSIPLPSFILIIITAFLGGVLVNMFAFFAMRTVKLSQYGALELTKPVFLALCGVLLLGEDISVLQMISGGVIILSSAYFLMSPKAGIKTGAS